MKPSTKSPYKFLAASTAAVALLPAASFAHPGHGALLGHIHGLEAALVVLAIAGLAFLGVRTVVRARKRK